MIRTQIENNNKKKHLSLSLSLHPCCSEGIEWAVRRDELWHRLDKIKPDPIYSCFVTVTSVTPSTAPVSCTVEHTNNTLCSTQTAAGCSWKESWRHFDAFLSVFVCLEDIFIGIWQQKHAVRKQDEFLLTWVFNSYVKCWLTFPQTGWQFELIESSV